QIGDFMRQLPIVVLAALSVSLIEALVILPAHLAHLPGKKIRQQESDTSRQRSLWRKLGSLQHHFMQSLLLPVYERFLRFALRWRYVTVAVAMGASLIALGMFVGKTSRGYSLGNLVKWEFVQDMDA